VQAVPSIPFPPYFRYNAGNLSMQRKGLMKKNGKTRQEISSIKIQFLLEAIQEAQQTNRFLDTKAGVLVSFESALLFLVVATVFDSQRFTEIKATILSMPVWNSALILAYCAAYLLTFVAHIIYTIKVLGPSKDPQEYVRMEGYKPGGLFFLTKDKSDGKIHPSVKAYAGRLASIRDSDVINELIFELMKLSYIRDTKAGRVQRSLEVLKYLIVGIVVFGIMLAFSY